MNERVFLEFRGLMLEIFLQQGLRQGVFFYGIQRRGRDGALLITDGPGAKKLMELARRYHLDVQETGREGPGVRLRRLGRRWTLAAALIVCGFLSFSFLSRLWIVNIDEPEGTGAQVSLGQALEQLGIRPGMPMGDIDVQALTASLQALCPQYAYVGVRARGVCLQVEAAPAQEAPPLYHPGDARDLVASRDALLLSLDVLAGTAAVKPGQVVRKGQVLIRGQERDGRDTTRGVQALGSAIGRVWLTGSARASLTREVLEDTGRRAFTRELKLPGKSIPLLEDEGFALERTQVRRIPLVGLLFPLYIEETTHIEQKHARITRDKEALQARIGEIAMNNALSLVPEEIWPVDKWVDYSMIEEGVISARAVVEIRPDIAVRPAPSNSSPAG